MSFFAFNLITDPPNDENVDEQVYLNANWDKLESRLNQFQAAPNTITSPPVGTEAMANSSNSVAVWDGSAWRFCDNIPSAWSAWADVALNPPVNPRTNYVLKWRYNSIIRKVELAGGVYYDNTQGPWSRTKVQITSDTSGIASTYNPVNGAQIQEQPCGIGTVDGQFAGARIHIEPNPTAGSPVRLYVSYQGDDIGGNFVMLDGVRWWY